MSSFFKSYRLLFIASILTPFVVTVFFMRSTNFLIILLLFFSALVALIVSTITLRDRKKIRKIKDNYLMIAIFSVLLFFVSYKWQLDAADFMFFKLRENKLNNFITELKNYDKIKQMSEGQRFWKSINHTSIEPDIKHVDTTQGAFGPKYFLDDILKRDGVDKEHYELFRQKLIDLGFESFTVLDDGTVSFTIDGFIDNCFGFAYSETGKSPKENDCGEIIDWTKVGNKWYSWGTT